tara:strand:+ start:777 stop:1055 length:279 start_codon:yes stop_codon:yes gene_type:complete
MKNKLTKIRYDLDKLDSSLLNLIKKRTILVEKVLKTKKHKNQIIDKKRIKEILKNIRKKSLQRKIDPEITKIIWTNMIKAYIKYEFKRFNKK